MHAFTFQYQEIGGLKDDSKLNLTGCPLYQLMHEISIDTAILLVICIY
jgi:hypothetical protein